jgi:formylglycine-generating enzyme required for sulfatase activity
VTVTAPVLLARGKPKQLRLTLPAHVPDGMVYVPPGCFLSGTDDESMRDLLQSSPLHQVCMERGYLIGRTEITFGEWIQYLDTLPRTAEARRSLVGPPPAAGGFMLRWQPTGGWTLSFFRSEKLIWSAQEGEDYRYQARTRNASGNWSQLPLAGVSMADLQGYFDWLDRSGRLRGARFCDEEEWVRAARGADARVYPGGDHLLTDDANTDVTYGRDEDAYGPDMVGSYSGYASPFGVFDTVGNAQEMTIPVTLDQSSIVLKSGSWYFLRITAYIANRAPGEPTMRDLWTGARACAPEPDFR